MAIAKLPASPSLENLKKRAKALVKSARAKDPDTLELIGPYFGDPNAIALQQAQLVLAREYGFSSWAKLKAYIESAAPGSETGEQLANRFLDLVTVIYHNIPDLGPARFAQASDLLAGHPDIRRENIHTAAAIGDVAQLDRWLDADPGLLERKGGPFQWPPLMYAAYARLPGVSTLAAGLRLLERGADPNAYHMWGGQYRFTALTGVFGEGEGGPVTQPEHPDMIPFARALLEAGADPNDSQAAYNRCFTPDNTCLELLLAYGLAPDDRNNWTDEDGRPHPAQTMHFQLMQAIHRGFLERVSLLIDHGVDLERPDDSYDNRTKGKTPLQAALLLGAFEIADRLRAAGAREPDLSGADAFAVACMQGDTDTAREMLVADPALRNGLREREMLCDAVKLGNHGALATMIALALELNSADGRTPLHEAALQGDIEAVQMLLDAGADATIRDPYHDAPPIGWAQHAGKTEAVQLLEGAAMDVFTAAAFGNIDRIDALLKENPKLLEQRFAGMRTGEGESSNDWMTPLVYAVLNNRTEAVRHLIDRGADPAVSNGSDQSLPEMARNNADPEITSLINNALKQ
ncbi:MAG: ankyrin repeat domain-containing protein [Pseudomonadota bacterium]